MQLEHPLESVNPQQWSGWSWGLSGPDCILWPGAPDLEATCPPAWLPLLPCHPLPPAITSLAQGLLSDPLKQGGQRETLL